jgi:hypothetical protein
VPGVEWLRNLGLLTIDFNDLTMLFQQEDQHYKFQGITIDSLEIISFHRMEKLFKIGHSDIIAQLHSIQVVESPSMHPNLQSILSQHHTFFQTPQGFNPSRDDHDHSVPLILGSIPPNLRLYCHPFAQKIKFRKLSKSC